MEKSRAVGSKLGQNRHSVLMSKRLAYNLCDAGDEMIFDVQQTS